VAYGGRFKTDKGIQIRRVRSAEVDIQEREQRKDHRQSRKNICDPEKAANLAIAPRGLTCPEQAPRKASDD
jgi:hypothetical protein